MPCETPAPAPTKRQPPLRLVWELLSKTYNEWRKHNAPTLGAALAFYTTFSMAPLLIIVIAIFGVVLGKETVQVEILRRTEELIGAQGSGAVKMMIGAAYRPGTGLPATIIGSLVILIGSTSALVMLKQALNIMWGAEPDPQASVWNLVKGRLLSFVMILIIGFLLVVSLMVSIALSFVAEILQNWVPVPVFSIQMADWGVSILLVTLLFAMVFKILPDVKIAWSDVWVGSAITAILFTLGKFLFGMYLARSSISSAYGAASSLAIILMWVYYSAQVLFIGAELTQVYANRYGSHVKPCA
ncbi:MAG: YihY/virulence factor BrkB family protein [Deltaproteobacteria bacterium]|nr:YihY/virulence factor BrkB family protein [Deltaproteobacteria bacterium]